MELTPHSLHMIISRIKEQMRCPQCGTPVIIDFPSVKLAADNFLILQLKCGSCGAFIVLHVTVADAQLALQQIKELGEKNISSTLMVSDDDLKTLQSAIEKADGSFEKMFKQG